MKSFFIGRYQLGWRMVDLWADTGTGGWFNLCIEQKNAQIHVGMDYPYQEAFEVLFHEVLEAVMCDMDCCYASQYKFAQNASDVRMFFFNHNQHTEISAKAAFFIGGCLDDFKKAWKKCRKT